MSQNIIFKSEIAPACPALKDPSVIMQSEIASLLATQEDARRRAIHYSEYAPIIRANAITVGMILDSMNLLRLPRNWREYAHMERWSLSNTEPVVSINPEFINVYIDKSNDEYCNGRYVLGTPVEVSVTICVTARPCWEVWARWSNEIIDEFYRAMREVRCFYGNPELEDKSKTSVTSQWDGIRYSYRTKRPVAIHETSLASPVLVYGREYNTRTLNTYIEFSLEIPNKPGNSTSVTSSACRIEEVEVEEVRKKVVRRVVCGE